MGYNRKAYIVFWTKILCKAFKYKLPFIKSYQKDAFRRDAAILFIQMFNGKSSEELQDFFNLCITDIMRDLNPLIVKEVNNAQKNGYSTVLLSGCLTDILVGVGNNLEMDVIIGTDLPINNTNSIKFYNKEFDIIMGKRKTEKLLEIMEDKNIDWENSIAYGDSSYDENVLRLVGKPIAVNPDKGLKTIAELNGWAIING